MTSRSERRALCRAILPACIAAAFAVPGAANAVEFDTGNPDLAVRWDNTLRYNLGVRAQKQSQAIINTPGVANSDLKFDRGDVITNRVDLLSELDVVYKDGQMGFRVSGQGWYDGAYNDKEISNPALGPRSVAYPGQRYSNFAKRWTIGPSGEFLDAFVFTRFNLGDVENNVRLGSHNLYWGESLFSFVHGVSYSQGPVDVRKALATPGVEAKELFRPLNQLSFSSQLADNFSIAGQYFLDWKPGTMPDGGTYKGIADYMTYGGGTMINGALPFVGINHAPAKDRGDWGLMSKWSPAWLGGTAGVYYRQYTDKIPLIVAGPGFSNFGFDFLDKRTTLVGASLSKNIGGVAVGAEIAHRSNTALLMGSTTTVGTEPVGDTWHALVNAVGYVGKTGLFDSMAWMGELTYSKLDKVSKNARNFKSKDYGCAGATANLGCADDYSVGIALKVEPKWFQVFDGVDLSMPLFYTTGLKGTSPVLFGGYEGNGSFSLGLTADVKNKYSIALAYNGAFTKHTDGINPATGKPVVLDVGSIGDHWDRGNVTLTFKTTF